MTVRAAAPSHATLSIAFSDAVAIARGLSADIRKAREGVRHDNAAYTALIANINPHGGRYADLLALFEDVTNYENMRKGLDFGAASPSGRDVLTLTAADMRRLVELNAILKNASA